MAQQSQCESSVSCFSLCWKSILKVLLYVSKAEYNFLPFYVIPSTKSHMKIKGSHLKQNTTIKKIHGTQLHHFDPPHPPWLLLVIMPIISLNKKVGNGYKDYLLWVLIFRTKKQSDRDRDVWHLFWEQNIQVRWIA